MQIQLMTSYLQDMSDRIRGSLNDCQIDLENWFSVCAPWFG